MNKNLNDIIKKYEKFNSFKDQLRMNDSLLSPDEKIARLAALIDLALRTTPPEKIEKIRNDKLNHLIDIQKRLKLFINKQNLL